MTTLAPEEVRALHDALDDEQQAWTTWSQVLRDLGAVSPFTTLVEARARQLEKLARLFAQHELPLPPNR